MYNNNSIIPLDFVRRLDTDISFLTKFKNLYHSDIYNLQNLEKVNEIDFDKMRYLYDTCKESVEILWPRETFLKFSYLKDFYEIHLQANRFIGNPSLIGNRMIFDHEFSEIIDCLKNPRPKGGMDPFVVLSYCCNCYKACTKDNFSSYYSEHVYPYIDKVINYIISGPFIMGITFLVFLSSCYLILNNMSTWYYVLLATDYIYDSGQGIINFFYNNIFNYSINKHENIDYSSLNNIIFNEKIDKYSEIKYYGLDKYEPKMLKNFLDCFDGLEKNLTFDIKLDFKLREIEEQYKELRPINWRIQYHYMINDIYPGSLGEDNLYCLGIPSNYHFDKFTCYYNGPLDDGQHIEYDPVRKTDRAPRPYHLHTIEFPYLRLEEDLLKGEDDSGTFNTLKGYTDLFYLKDATLVRRYFYTANNGTVDGYTSLIYHPFKEVKVYEELKNEILKYYTCKGRDYKNWYYPMFLMEAPVDMYVNAEMIAIIDPDMASLINPDYEPEVEIPPYFNPDAYNPNNNVAMEMDIDMDNELSLKVEDVEPVEPAKLMYFEPKAHEYHEKFNYHKIMHEGGVMCGDLRTIERMTNKALAQAEILTNFREDKEYRFKNPLEVSHLTSLQDDLKLVNSYDTALRFMFKHYPSYIGLEYNRTN